MNREAADPDRATMPCQHCRSVVPATPFCGECGAHLTPRPGDGPAWLRPDGLFAAPHESVFRPSLASSLLPQLSEFTRRPFNTGLLLIIIALAVLVELQLPGGLITVASLGLPMLLLIYWRRSRVLDDVPRWTVWTAVLGAVVLGVGWVLATGDLTIREAASPFQAGSGGRRALRQNLAVSDVRALVMLVPLVVVRLVWWRRPREALDGFVIGVLSSLMFAAAVTLTRLAPHLGTAPIPRNQPIRWLFFEAAVRGVTVPLAAACFGGLIGAGLWFNRTRPANRFGHARVVATVMGLGLSILAIYAAVGRADADGAPPITALSLHIGVAVFALIALRVGLQLAVLGEQTPPVAAAPLLCLHCRQVVPEMTFCPACGAATRASSTRSREERRQVTPSPPDGPDDPTGPTPVVWPGYAVPAQTYTAARFTRQSPIPVLTRWAAGMLVLSAIFIGLPALTVTPLPRYNCPPDCGTPPSGEPVSYNPRFSGAGGLFSVAYPSPESAYTVTTDDTGVTAKLNIGDGGELRMMGQRANGNSAQEIAQSFLDTKFPTANKAYEIPNAMVGFEPGYGEVADVFPLNLNISSVRMRVMVIVAVKNDVALIASAFGPFHQFGPDFGPGLPSPANLQIAADLGKFVNSFEWTGES